VAASRHQPGVVLRIDENIAIAQHKRLRARKILGQLDHPAGAVLHHLRHVFDRDAKFRPVTEMLAHHLRSISHYDQHPLHPGCPQPLDDMLQNRPSAHRQHRLGQVVGEFLHPRATARSEKNGLSDE